MKNGYTMRLFRMTDVINQHVYVRFAKDYLDMIKKVYGYYDRGLSYDSLRIERILSYEEEQKDREQMIEYFNKQIAGGI